MLFYLDPAVNADKDLKEQKDVLLTYTFFPSHDQTVADVLTKEIEKHQDAQKKLIEKKKTFKAEGKKWDEEASNKLAAQAVPFQGYDPKSKPEDFVKKFMNNQKRINRMIDNYKPENPANP